MSGGGLEEVEEVDTPHGVARLHVAVGERAHGVLVLGHGAGGGVAAPDLLGATGVFPGVAVRVEQPYRVAGRRAPSPAGQLDTAWAAVLGHVARRWPDLPQVHGGRSSGARVACRGAVTLPPEHRPVGVLALAFPLRAPARRDGTRPDRGAELDAVTDAGIPVLAVTGERDRFGIPDAVDGRQVVVIAGDHSLRARGRVAEVVGSWFDRLVGSTGPSGRPPAGRW